VANRIPTVPRLLESPGFFYLKIPGPGKFWKITLVLESPGKIVATGCHILRLKCTKFDFGILREGKGGQGFRRRGKGFFFTFKHTWALKRSWKISHWGPGKSWIFCQ